MPKRPQTTARMMNYRTRMSRNLAAHGGRRVKKRFMNKQELDQVCKYLENPVSCGVWYLHAKWNLGAGTTHEILDQAKELRSKHKKGIPRNIDFLIRREDVPQEYAQSIMADSDLERLTFLFDLFYYVYLNERSRGKIPIEDLYRAFTGEEEAIETLMILDAVRIRKKFNAAYECFKKDILHEPFVPSVTVRNFSRIASGYFLMTERIAENGRLNLASLNPSPLKAVEEFLTKAGKIKDSRLCRVFSPEEEVFAPYISFLKASYDEIIHNPNTAELIGRSIDLYDEKKYPYCVSTFGLVGEDYITQVYETLFREPCPDGKTLGQTYDLIHSRIRSRFTKSKSDLSDLGPIKKNIDQMLAERKAVGETTIKKILMIQKEILKHMKLDREWTKTAIKSGGEEKPGLSVFPEQIGNNIKELIEYRNATAHKSRTPIGDYEALRSAYCLTSLAMWWSTETSITDWHESPLDILKKAITRNTGQVPH